LKVTGQNAWVNVVHPTNPTPMESNFSLYKTTCHEIKIESYRLQTRYG
jgi:hypothetical protein